MAVGAADQEGDVRHAVVAPAFRRLAKASLSRTLPRRSSATSTALAGTAPEQQFAFARDQLGGRQLPLFLELAQRERPADAAGIVLIEIAFGPAAGAADAGDQ